MDTETTAVAPTEQAAKTDSKATGVTDAPRVDVSAQTVTRMMGIATVTDLKLVESRIDLLSTKVTAIMTKVDRISATVNALPSGSDMDRLEIQLGSLKSLVKEILEAVMTNDGAANKAGAQEQSKKIRDGIRTNTDSSE